MTASEIAYLIAVKETAREGKGGEARSKDVAERIGLSRASVSRAVEKLCAKRLAARTERNGVVLTDAGAAEVERYEACIAAVQKAILKRFGCRECVAKADALRVVCALSAENFKRLCEEEVQKCR